MAAQMNPESKSRYGMVISINDGCLDFRVKLSWRWILIIIGTIASSPAIAKIVTKLLIIQ